MSAMYMQTWAGLSTRRPGGAGPWYTIPRYAQHIIIHITTTSNWNTSNWNMVHWNTLKFIPTKTHADSFPPTAPDLYKTPYYMYIPMYWTVLSYCLLVAFCHVAYSWRYTRNLIQCGVQLTSEKWQTSNYHVRLMGYFFNVKNQLILYIYMSTLLSLFPCCNLLGSTCAVVTLMWTELYTWSLPEGWEASLRPWAKMDTEQCNSNSLKEFVLEKTSFKSQSQFSLFCFFWDHPKLDIEFVQAGFGS